jgi:hypothetical protein
MTARVLVGDQNRGIGLNSVSVDPSYVAYQRLSSPQRSSRTNSSVVQPGLLQLEGAGRCSTGTRRAALTTARSTHASLEAGLSA